MYWMNHVVIFLVLSLFFIACGGIHEYKLQNVQPITTDRVIPGSISFVVNSENVYHHALGIHTYELYVKDAMEKQFQDSLGKCFQQGVMKGSTGDYHIMITALDTSVFPISSVISDVRLFFRVQIFDKQMQLQKTTTVYGFGSSSDGNVALEKAVGNAFRQLLPILEELFIRQ